MTLTSVAVIVGPMMAAPTAIAAPVGEPGAVMTKSEMSAFGCTKGGHSQAVGWARCRGTKEFKVRVWCTWAGQGLSNDWLASYNWARCSSGEVHDEDDGIEIIWS